MHGVSWRNLFFQLHIACFMLQVRSCSLGGPTTALRIKLITKSFLQSHLDCQVHCNPHALHSPAWQEITTDPPSQTQCLRLNSLLHSACYSSSRLSSLLTVSSLCASSHPKPADALWCCGGPQQERLWFTFQWPWQGELLALASLELCFSWLSLHVAGATAHKVWWMSGICLEKCIPKN